MKRLKILCAGVAFVSLSGCQSLAVMAIKSFDPKPYSLPVAAQQLAPIPADATQAAVTPPADASPAPALAESAPASAPVAEAVPEPARTDIRGQGDGQMVDERVMITAQREVAHRVPDYSREQVAAMLCSRRISGPPNRLNAAQRAYDATLAAYDVRTAFIAGQRTAKEANDAERKRQDAVNAMSGNSMLFNMFGGRSKKADLPKPELDGLILEKVDLYTFSENGQPVMAVSGVVRNTTDKPVRPPPVSLTAIDQWEFILAGQTSLLPFETLEPGESKSFELRFHNPPDTTYEVAAHFVPPFEYRMRRECDLAEIASGKPVIAPRSATAAALATSPVHTAAELNLLMRVYRSEAESAWTLRSCGEPPKESADDPKKKKTSGSGFKVAPGGGGESRSFSVSINLGKFNTQGLCAAWSRRLPWRESFALGEATDEAWGALLARDETERRLAAGLAVQADLDAAEGAWRHDYAAFRALGAKTLVRAGGSVPDVEIAIASSTFGYDQMSKAFDGADISQVGFYVDVAGSIHNTAQAPRQIGALMLALVDRLEQPLLTFRLDEAVALAPGETREFKHRVYFNNPVRRGDSKEAPPWQVRIGAVSEKPVS